MALVLDCSVALAWVLPDEDDTQAGQVLARVAEEGAVAPGLWPLEVANVLLTAERRGRLTREEVQRALSALRALPIEIDPDTPARAFGEVLELATSHGLTVYDATYLELAQRRQLALATHDARLRAAAVAAGVEVV